MNAQKNVNTSKELSTEALNHLIIDCIQDIKGKNIVKLDLRDLDDAPTDYFIVCEGDSDTQVRAIADRISRHVQEETGVPPSHVEGRQRARWVLLDYFTTVVHIFYRETRGFYQLEDMWSDAVSTEYQSL